MALNPKITDWKGKRVWLLGASSGIGEALAVALAAKGAWVALSGRRAEALENVHGQLPGIGHLVLPCNAGESATLTEAIIKMEAAWGGVDLAIYLAGDYVPLRADDFSPAQIAQLCSVNYLGAVNFTHAVLPLLRAGEPGGGVALVASVAGYRGLPKALGYGPAKAALIHFAEVLYLDLHARGLAVWLVNPGFVATRLTAQNDFKMPALVSAETAAEAMLAGFTSGSFEIHFPKRFTRFMKFMRLLPYALYFRLVGRIATED